MASIEKRPGGKWRAKCRVGGGLRYGPGRRLKADAVRDGVRIDEEMARGFDSRQAKRSLSRLIEDYCRDTDEQLKRPRSVRWRRSMLDRWVRILGDPEIQAVGKPEIKRGMRLLRDAGLQASTVNRYVGRLSGALSWAVAEEWIQYNPCTRLYLTEPRGRERYLDPEVELPALRDAYPKLRAEWRYPEQIDRLECLVECALASGARREELLSLRRQDVDLGAGTAIVRDTKNGETRRITLTGRAAELLRRRLEVPRIDTDLVFASPGTKRAAPPRRSWERLMEISGIENFTFHCLRHTAASYLAMSGATDAELMDFGGWKDRQMVQRYAHLSPEHVNRKAREMNERFL